MICMSIPWRITPSGLTFGNSWASYRRIYRARFVHPDGTAIAECNESGHVTSYSYRELRERVHKPAAALKVHGLQTGDRVAGSASV